MTVTRSFLALALAAGLLSACATQAPAEEAALRLPGSNPLFSDAFTADPAPMVHDGPLQPA